MAYQKDFSSIKYKLRLRLLLLVIGYVNTTPHHHVHVHTHHTVHHIFSYYVHFEIIILNIIFYLQILK
jgi:hypothetical protein